ncbi:unnamed protein product, partial [Ectocarpus sp. 13 AM-2016]
LITRRASQSSRHTDEAAASGAWVLLEGSLTKRLSGDAWKDAVATAAVYTVFI